MRDYAVVGKPLPRVDAVAKVTGAARYVADMRLPRMLHGKILRSPIPHARILHIDTRRAERVVGVKAVITGEETPKRKYGIFPWLPQAVDHYPLAIDKVRFIGDEVAAVAAMDEETAAEALDLIRVEYEELPSVFDPLRAMAPDAPEIHAGVKDNRAFFTGLDFGSVEAGFAECDYVREDEFSTPYISQAPLETHAALAACDPVGKLVVWSTTQSPYLMRRDLATTLAMAESDIRVIKPALGGAFGGKNDMCSLDFCAALLSLKSGQPVKIVYSREEEFMATRPSYPTRLKLKTGVKRDGTLVAKECEALVDVGAYINHGILFLYVMGGFLTSLYRTPNVRYRGTCVYTNKEPGGPMRGHGNQDIRFVDDSQLDMIAHHLGIDPVEIRLKNAVRSGDVTANGWKITSCGLSESIRKAAEVARWQEKKGKLPPYRGIGIACGNHVSGAKCFEPFESSAALVKLQKDGRIVLFTGACDIGQGTDTALCQIVAEELGVRLEDVSIVAADTELAPDDLGAFASRTVFVAGKAVQAAARDAREQLFKVAAGKLEANAEDLEIRERRISVRGSPEKGMELAAAIRMSCCAPEGNPILGRGFYSDPCELPDPRTGIGNQSSAYSFGAQVAEVEVDPESGKVKVLQVVDAHDCGFAINPQGVEAQLDGSVHMGMGLALSEGLQWDGGQILNGSFLEYKIPTSLDTPRVTPILIEPIDPQGPFGAKGIGESTQIPTAPAIANAVYDAIGARIKDLPITPDKILRALRRPTKEKTDPAEIT